MRARVCGAAMVGVLTFSLGGCAMDSTPSYSEVTDQTKASLQEIVDLMPPGSVAMWRPEQEPYSCSDSMLLSKRDGYFYTGAIDVILPSDTDVPSLVANLSEQLSEGWEKVPTDLKLTFPTIGLTDTTTGVQVNVMGSKPAAPPSVFLTGISRCGVGAAE